VADRPGGVGRVFSGLARDVVLMVGNSFSGLEYFRPSRGAACDAKNMAPR